MGDNPENTPQPSVTRDEKGRVLKGSILNPNGERGKTQWQPIGNRLEKWFSIPRGELKAMLNDEASLDRLSTIDVAAIRLIAGTISGKATLKSLEIALDRIEGKPILTVRNEGPPPIEPADIESVSDDEAAAMYQRKLNETRFDV